MSNGYTKLFSSITDSTIWQEPDATRLVWITMLAMSDQHGYVGSSVPGLANRARVSIDACLIALETFMSPDKWSRTPDFEGRRIDVADGGWVLLNHGKYREERQSDERREYMRKYMKEKRALTNVSNVSRGYPPLAQAEAEAEAEALKPKPIVVCDAERLVCPIEKILEAYHRLMPENPRCKVINADRKSSIKSRWKEAAKLTCPPFGYDTHQKGIAAWESFFKVCAESKFLTGKSTPSPGHTVFFADIDFLFSPSGFAKCLENKYHRE